MEKNEIKPLFSELWKQLKVIYVILADIVKVLVDKAEKSASKRMKKNPIITLIVISSILLVLLLVTNLGWFVKYKATVKDGDYIEMEVSKRVDQEKIRIEAEANELAFNRYQVKVDSLSQEIVKLKGKKNPCYYNKKIEVKKVDGVKNDIEKENKTNEVNRSSNGDDFVEVKE